MSKTTEVNKHLARFVTNWFENRKLAITVQEWISDMGIDHSPPQRLGTSDRVSG